MNLSNAVLLEFVQLETQSFLLRCRQTRLAFRRRLKEEGIER